MGFVVYDGGSTVPNAMGEVLGRCSTSYEGRRGYS